MRLTKPMLAAAVKDITALRYPLLASPKLDGIRCLALGGQALTRSFKAVPNLYIRGLVSELPGGFDGELIVGKTFQETTSAVMSIEGAPKFTYWVFDHIRSSDFDLTDPFADRYNRVLIAKRDLPSWVKVVRHSLIKTPEALLEYEAKILQRGYEGVCLRDPDGPYKCGRSTLKEGYLLKLKRFVDAEARVVGTKELQHNQNTAFKGELGQTKRSSAKAGKRRGGTLGALIVEDLQTGVRFSLGAGLRLTKAARAELWAKRSTLNGKLVRYRYQAYGVKDKPRIAIFLGFRDCRDL